MSKRAFVVQTAAFTDQLTSDGHQLTKRPYPIVASEDDGMVRGWVSLPDAPFRVIGFMRDPAVQQIDLWWADAVKDPSRAVGMYLVTSNKAGGWGIHDTAVERFEAIEPAAG